MKTRRGLPRRPHFLESLFGGAAVGALGGGGGGGGGSTKFYKWYKNYILQQQAKQETDQARVEEQGKTQADVRRGELADRTGYAGLVNVGPAVQDTDATLAARMALLAPDDPQRVTYDKAVADEMAKKEQAKRIITGEQYEAEDAFKALSVDKNTDLGAFEKSLESLKQKYAWFDTADIAGRLEAERQRRAKNAADRQTRRQAGIGVAVDNTGA